MSLNSVSFLGRLITEPVLLSAGEGTKTFFVVAVDRDYRKADGDRETDFLPCVAWNERAKYIIDHYSKGDTIAISGRVQSHKYTNGETGAERTQIEIYVMSTYHCGSSSKAQESEPAGRSRTPF